MRAAPVAEGDVAPGSSGRTWGCDRAGGGTVVTLSFDASLLAPLAAEDSVPPGAGSTDDDRTIAALTRNRI